MKLFELFDTTHDLTGAKISKGPNHYEVEQMVGGRKIQFKGGKSDGIWTVSFAEMYQGENDWKEQPHHELSGKGHAPEVLSFVISCIKKLCEEMDPQKLRFSATKADRSRASVYEKIVNREFADSYDVAKKEMAGGYIYTLTKKAA